VRFHDRPTDGRHADSETGGRRIDIRPVGRPYGGIEAERVGADGGDTGSHEWRTLAPFATRLESPYPPLE